jgi:putative flippase GtrA
MGIIIQIKKHPDRSIYRFLIVGFINTIIGLALIYLLYNVFNLGYWGSTAPVYLVGSILSYVLNKNYTFSYKKKDVMSIVRFLIVQAIAYTAGYLIARPLVSFSLSNIDIGIYSETGIVEQISIVAGMGFYVVLAYLGQRLFAFNSKYAK